MFGEAVGMTAGRGIDGLGETDRRIDCAEPNEDRRLCVVGGGFIGSASDCGVPGADGLGEPTARSSALSFSICARPRNSRTSDGTGLFDEIRRIGISILVILLCWASVKCPSLVLRV